MLITKGKSGILKGVDFSGIGGDSFDFGGESLMIPPRKKKKKTKKTPPAKKNAPPKKKALKPATYYNTPDDIE